MKCKKSFVEIFLTVVFVVVSIVFSLIAKSMFVKSKLITMFSTPVLEFGFIDVLLFIGGVIAASIAIFFVLILVIIFRRVLFDS